MAGKTPRLGLNYLDSAQAQPEVPLNENADILDELSGAVWVEELGSSPGDRSATKLIFANCTVEAQTDGAVLITPDTSSGGGGGGSPLHVTDGTVEVINVLGIRFTNGATVSEASAGIADVYIDPVSAGSAASVGIYGIFTNPPTSGWAWNNQGANTESAFENGFHLQVPSDAASTNIRTYERAFAGGDFDCKAFLTMSATGGGSVAAGLSIRDSSSGKLQIWAADIGANGNQVVSYTFSGNTAFNGTAIAATNPTPLHIYEGCWFRVKRVSALITLYISNDGVNWIPIGNESGNYVSAADKIGIATFNNRVSTPDAAVNVLSWNVT
jgi:hypothetical protein